MPQLPTKANDTLILEKDIPRERSHFNLLLASNPNYFSNLEGSPFKGIIKQVGNTTYEKIECVGLNPQLDLLEAVIAINQNFGYNGSICAPGSLEYVRFYADYANSGTWTDLGYSTVRVHDLPGDLPVCYAARVHLDPPRHLCTQSNVIRVRAILSWNALPPANTPGFPPVWGNVVNVNVQLRPRLFWFVGELVKELGTIKELPKAVADGLQAFDPSAELQVTPKSLTLPELQKLYRDAKVPAHRFAFAELSQALQTPTALESTLIGQAPLSEFLSKADDLEAIIAGFLKPPTNTTYEQVTCTGLRPEDDTVGAVITIKQPNGYLGDLCHTGSAEYVGFWLKLDGSPTWEHLGTTAVQVHDLGAIPAGGVQYAAFLPVDLSAHRRRCTAGPLMGTLRAVLQWNAPPTSPTLPPYWGNSEDCRVQLRPGDPDSAQIPALLNVSGFSVDDINGATGLLNGNAPFGGVVALRGILGGFSATPRQYKVQIRKDGELNWRTLTNPIDVQFFRFDAANNIVDCSGAAGFQFQCTRNLVPSAGLDPGWYDYINATTGGTHDVLTDNTLGYWLTNTTDEGLWHVKVTFRDAITLVTVETQTVTVRIDNTAPRLFADFAAGGQCGKFAIGAQLSGSYQAHDPGSNPLLTPAVLNTPVFQHFNVLSATVLPPGLIPQSVNLDGTGSNVEGLPNIGADGSWTLNTANGQPCGYVIRFLGSDRTVYGTLSGASFNLVTLTGEYDLGFCLG